MAGTVIGLCVTCFFLGLSAGFAISRRMFKGGDL